MIKTIRIQSMDQQDEARRRELAARTPAQRMNMLFSLIDRSAKQNRLQRVVSIRNVPVR